MHVMYETEQLGGFYFQLLYRQLFALVHAQKLGDNLPLARGEKRGEAAHARRRGVRNWGAARHKLLHIFVGTINTKRDSLDTLCLLSNAK